MYQNEINEYVSEHPSVLHSLQQGVPQEGKVRVGDVQDGLEGLQGDRGDVAHHYLHGLLGLGHDE